MRYILLALLLVTASSGQIINSTAIQYTAGGGTPTEVVDISVQYFTGEYDNITAEWYAILAPGLNPQSPSYPLASSQVWQGAWIPYGLDGNQWLCMPREAPSGLIYDLWTGAVTGEAIPMQALFGGCAFGYAAMGQNAPGSMAISGWMPIARFVLPTGMSMVGEWVFLIGWVEGPTGGKFRTRWARVF